MSNLGHFDLYRNYPVDLFKYKAMGNACTAMHCCGQTVQVKVHLAKEADKLDRLLNNESRMGKVKF